MHERMHGRTALHFACDTGLTFFIFFNLLDLERTRMFWFRDLIQKVHCVARGFDMVYFTSRTIYSRSVVKFSVASLNSVLMSNGRGAYKPFLRVVCKHATFECTRS
jgi:hypothetical protein